MAKNAITEDLLAFWTRIAALIDEGRPLLPSLLEVHAELPAGGVRDAVATLAGDVSGGATLSERMKKQSEIFGRAAVCFVEGGEHAGIPGKAMGFIAENMAACPQCAAWSSIS